MDFSRLPEPAILKIIEYLQLEDYFRIGRVNKTLRQIGQLAISRTKYLDLGEDRFRKLNADQLAVILDLCASNLERFKIGGEIGDDNHWKQLAITFANYQCPRLIDMNLGETPIDHAVFQQLIQNCPNMECLEWHKDCMGFPAMTNNNLKKLYVHVCSDTSLQTLIGHCPNLEELVLTAGDGITVSKLDKLFGSIQHAQRIKIDLFYMDASNFEEAEMANFYKLPLTELSIDFDSDDDNCAGDDLLSKVATSFPNLREVSLGFLDPTSAGIALLADLRELQVLELHLYELDGELYDQGIRQLANCQNLRKLDVGQSDITRVTLVNMFRSCPQLENLGLRKITEVDRPDEAVVMVESLAGIPQREIAINFGGSVFEDEIFESIWKSEPVKAAIRKLEEEGLKIKMDN